MHFNLNKTLTLFLLICCFFIGQNVFAQSLEVSLPDLPNMPAPDDISTDIAYVMKYFYNLSIIIAGMLAFVMLVWGGFKYLLAGPNPGRLKDAKEQMGMALLGILLILGSWMLVNTINPELTSLEAILPVDKFEDVGTIDPPDPGDLPGLLLYEVPVGTLITSEYRVSEFIEDFDTDDNYDIDYSDPNIIWPPEEASSDRYNTDFQGALYGARLKRIIEISEVEFEVLQKLEEESMELADIIEECKCSDNCRVISSGCTPEGGKCLCDASQKPCSDDTIEKMEKQITTSEHFTEAFERFLNSDFLMSDSVVEDYYEANKGEIDAIEDQEVKDAIQLMIETENKGGYSPDPDPLERDVGTSLLEMTVLLDSLKQAKQNLNPFDQDTGHQGALTFAQATSLEQELNTGDTTIEQTTVPFMSGFKSVDVKDDPATFYFLGNLPLTNKNIVYADDYDYPGISADQLDDFEDVNFDLENPYSARSTCSNVVEIPIGTALDEAIKLTQNIQEELFNTYVYGYAGVLRSKLAITSAKIVKNLNCTTACFSPFCISYLIFGVPYSQCAYLPPVTAKHCRGILIPALVLSIRQADAMLKDGIVGEAEKAYKKIQGEEPMGKDYFCTEDDGDCRDESWNLEEYKIEEREYDIRQKLAEVQLLLNKSRELSNPQRGKSVYQLLLEDYIALDLVHELDLSFSPQIELNYIQSRSGERLDLQTCGIYYEKQGEAEQTDSVKELLNCYNADAEKVIDPYDREACNPDPYLDKGYFYASSKREEYPLSCYCYDEDMEKDFYNNTRFPELYDTSMSLNVPQIDQILDNFHSSNNYFFQDSGGIDLGEIEDTNIIDNLQLDLPTLDDIDYNSKDLYNAIMNQNIRSGQFIGIGNNYYCCVEEL